MLFRVDVNGIYLLVTQACDLSSKLIVGKMIFFCFYSIVLLLLIFIEESEGKPPISVKFEIPYFTVSGIQVRCLPNL